MRQKFVIIDHFLRLQWCVFHSRENIPHNPRKCNPPIGSLSPAQSLRGLYPHLRSRYFLLRHEYSRLRGQYFHLRNRYFVLRNDSPADATATFTFATVTSVFAVITFYFAINIFPFATITWVFAAFTFIFATVTLSFAAFTRTAGRGSSPIDRQFYTSLVPPSCPARVRDYHLSPKKNLKKVR